MLALSQIRASKLLSGPSRSAGAKRCYHRSSARRSGSMYQHQASLPKLPVPELKDTMERYLVAIEPLVTPQQLQKTKQVVADFQSNQAWGPYLQGQLKELDRLTTTSYVEGFWDSMYLEIRDPIVTNVNPAFVISNNPHADQEPSKLASLLGTSIQIARTAQLLEASAKFVHLVNTQQLPPDMEKTTPLDMSQYPKLFSATRIPGYSRDVFKHVPEAQAKHVLVICRGRYFAVDILNAAGEPLGASAIASQLVSVESQALALGPDFHAIGPLTGKDRLSWSFEYGRLSGLGQNSAVLGKMEESLFAVCLEDSAPSNVSEAGQIALHGPSALNRYFDKSIQLIIYQDGRTGLNFEHTGFDGATILNYINAIYAYQADHASLSSVSAAKVAPRLQLNLDDSLKSAINLAQVDFQTRASGLDGALLNWQSHGKKFITSSGFSPDAYVQMAFQLTQKRLTGNIVSTYESSNVRHFNRGRTECVRSATSDAKAFVETFDSSATPEAKVAALSAATNRHASEAKKSKDGKLIDRHLQVLNWLSLQQSQRQAGYQRPTLFTDPSYRTHFASTLSTSNCGSPALEHFSFGAAHHGGFGIGYMIKDKNIPVAITSFHGKAQSFADGLKKALTDMQTLVSQNPAKKL